MRITDKIRFARPQRRKLNNKGLSLVEVIVAVTILSLVIVPTLHIITTAATYNAKARKRQAANVSAESIMEAFKGYDMDTLKAMFASGNGEITDGGVTKNFYDPLAGGVYSVDDSNPDSIVFDIEGLTSDEGKTYNIEVTATPKIEGNVVKVDNFNLSKDCVYEIAQVNDEDALKQRAIENLNSHKTEFRDYMIGVESEALDENGNRLADLIASNVDDKIVPKDNICIDKRKIEISIDNDGSKDNVSVSVKYHYHIEDLAYYVKLESDMDDNEPDEEGHSVVVTRLERTNYSDSYMIVSDIVSYPVTSFEADALSKLMIFYFPFYSASDELQIKNNRGSEIDCFLYKQRSKNMSDISCNTHEQRYNVSVTGMSTINLYHNLNRNLSGINNVVKTPVISGFGTAQAFMTVKDTADKLEVEVAPVFIAGGDKVLTYMLSMEVKEADTGVLVTNLVSTMNER